MLETDLCNDNYFYYAYLMGRFTERNCPRYLQADSFARLQQILLERPNVVQLRQGLLHMVMGDYPADTFNTVCLNRLG